MMFLLRAAFWLGLMLVLLPTGSKKHAVDTPQINAAEAATAATAAVADLSQFCTRRPETCAVGSTVASVLAQRAQAGAVMVYEFVTERSESAPTKSQAVPVSGKTATEARGADRTETTGSISAIPTSVPAPLIPRPRPAPSQDTLTAVDRHPIWRNPDLRQHAQLKHPD